LHACFVVSNADVDAPSSLLPFFVLRALFSRSLSLFPRAPSALSSKLLCIYRWLLHVFLVISDTVAAALSDVDAFCSA